MESHQNKENILEDLENTVSDVKMVDCPNCEETVPLSIYCLKCGFPMFDLMKEYQEKEIEEKREVSYNDPVNIQSDSENSNALKFRLEPADLDFVDKNIESPDSESDIKPMLEEKENNLDAEVNMSKEDPDKDAGAHAKDEEKPSSNLNIDIARARVQKRGFDPDEATQRLMQNLANSINLKLWSIGQFLDEKISKDNFENLHEGYDNRYRQLMDQRNERLDYTLDIINLEEKLERAYIKKSELEIRKTLNDLFEDEYEAKAPAFEWEINHCKILLENRKLEIAYLKTLEKVVKSEELEELVNTAKSYLERIQSSEGLMELINGTYGRLKTSMEEIVAFLEESE